MDGKGPIPSLLSFSGLSQDAVKLSVTNPVQVVPDLCKRPSRFWGSKTWAGQWLPLTWFTRDRLGQGMASQSEHSTLKVTRKGGKNKLYSGCVLPFTAATAQARPVFPTTSPACSSPGPTEPKLCYLCLTPEGFPLVAIHPTLLS